MLPKLQIDLDDNDDQLYRDVDALESPKGKIQCQGSEDPLHKNGVEVLLDYWPQAIGSTLDDFGIRILTNSKKCGRAWYSQWSTGGRRRLASGEHDPHSNCLRLLGQGSALIDGRGTLTLTGNQPMLTVKDFGSDSCRGVEITFYVNLCSVASDKSGTEHSNARGLAVAALLRQFRGPQNRQDFYMYSCEIDSDYHAALRKDKRDCELKEIWSPSHLNFGETPLVLWNAQDPIRLRREWIGYKFLLVRLEDGEVLLALFQDVSNAREGGKWVKIVETTDCAHYMTVRKDVHEKTRHRKPKMANLSEVANSIALWNNSPLPLQVRNLSVREIASVAIVDSSNEGEESNVP